MQRRGPGRPPASDQPPGRELILKAARELLAAQGTSRVTLRAVAERAGVQPPLVNYHFGSKDELFSAVIEEVISGLHDRIVSITDEAGPPEERLRSFVTQWVAALASDPYVPRLVAELVVFPDDERTDEFADRFARPVLETLVGVLGEGERDGSFVEVDRRFLGPTIVSLCVFFFLGAPAFRRVLGIDPGDPEVASDYAGFVADLLLARLRPPAGAPS